jgi:hypothetical protein
MPKTDNINESMIELEQELNKLNSASELISKAKDTAEKNIIETKDIISKLVKSSEKTLDKTVKESKQLAKVSKELAKNVELLVERLDNVDFPVRLDKIDTSVASINAGVQNIQGRVDSLENNLKDDVTNKLNDQLSRFKKYQNITSLALGAFIIITIVALLWNIGVLR